MVIQVREQVQFREVGGNAKQPLHIANHEADHAKSMKVLADNGLRPLTYQEALTHSSELVRELKGKWFYLEGNGTSRQGLYTFTDEGELRGATGNESYDKTIRVLPGNQPLSLYVNSDHLTQGNGKRFDLLGVTSPDDVAPVVVGVKQAQDGSAAATQNEELSRLLRVGKGQTIVLTYPNRMKTETKVPEGTTVHIE